MVHSIISDGFVVERFEVFDGFKFFFSDNEWLMIRSSGTEPLSGYMQKPKPKKLPRKSFFRYEAVWSESCLVWRWIVM